MLLRQTLIIPPALLLQVPALGVMRSGYDEMVAGFFRDILAVKHRRELTVPARIRKGHPEGPTTAVHLLLLAICLAEGELIVVLERLLSEPLALTTP